MAGKYARALMGGGGLSTAIPRAYLTHDAGEEGAVIFLSCFAVLVVPNVVLRQSFAGNVATRSTRRLNRPQRKL